MSNLITITIVSIIVMSLYGYIFLTMPKYITSALKIGITNFLSALPLILLAFALIGALQVILPKTFFIKYLSEQSGIKGILIGCFLGGIIPGPPYVWLSIAGALLKSGAGIGMVVGFLCSCTIWNFDLLPLEISFLGMNFVAIRIISTIIFPPIAGIIAHLFFKRFS